MPMIRCPYCELRQYAPATHATRPECGGCGRPFEVGRAALIARVVVAARAVRRDSRERTARHLR
jgi:sarcosine oxidase delta subunit